jgi:hypothetical protein
MKQNAVAGASAGISEDPTDPGRADRRSSRTFTELNSEKEAGVKSLTEGLYIKHSQYGNGVVTQSDVERTTIDFDAHGPKKFVTSMMVVEPVEGAPPKRPGSRRKKAATAAK